MSTLTLSYSLGLQARKQIGVAPSANSEQIVSLLEQSQGNILQEGESFKYSFSLNVNQTRTINLENLGVKYLKTLVLKSDNIIRLDYQTKITEGSLIFIDKKLPSVIPSVVTTDVISLLNTSSSSTDVSLTFIAIL